NGATRETKSLNVISKSEISALVKNDVNIDNIEPTIEINQNLSAPISQDAVVGKISYEIDGENYSTDLIAETSVEESKLETIIFRAFLIFLILYILVIILKKLNKHKNNKKSYFLSENKRTKKSKKSNAKKGGRYKFNQINDYL